VGKIYGRGQALPLDCESRSAVDWAAFFGRTINELEFFGYIPKTDNPDKGFVGTVYGAWGNLPPYGYGVHAGPVALLLRDYDVPAHAYRGLSWDQLRSEIAAGRPVILWVVGHVGYSTPVSITLADGVQVSVARYEHTVILIGYDSQNATVLDGAWEYSVKERNFLRSWDILGNMAILAAGGCHSTAMELIP
jgi:uncharacterized protein YvpB